MWPFPSLQPWNPNRISWTTLREVQRRFLIHGKTRIKSSFVRKLERYTYICIVIIIKLCRYVLWIYIYIHTYRRLTWQCDTRLPLGPCDLIWLIYGFWLCFAVHIQCNSEAGARFNTRWATNKGNSSRFSNFHERPYFFACLHSWDSICKSCSGSPHPVPNYF